MLASRRATRSAYCSSPNGNNERLEYVDTVYRTDVGDGRKVRRYGRVDSMTLTGEWISLPAQQWAVTMTEFASGDELQCEDELQLQARNGRLGLGREWARPAVGNLRHPSKLRIESSKFHPTTIYLGCLVPDLPRPIQDVHFSEERVSAPRHNLALRRPVDNGVTAQTNEKSLIIVAIDPVPVLDPTRTDENQSDGEAPRQVDAQTVLWIPWTGEGKKK